MSVLGSLLKNRRAGEKHLAWSLPNLDGPETLTVTSHDFGDGETMPLRTASKRCGGQDQSPRLAWSDVPEGTAQLLLVVEDPDAPTPKPFIHCLALLEPAAGPLPPGALSAADPAPGVRVLRSGMGRGYLGPAPVKGHGPHRYVFELFALPSAVPDTAERLRPRAAMGAAGGPVLARGRLSGVFER